MSMKINWGLLLCLSIAIVGSNNALATKTDMDPKQNVAVSDEKAQKRFLDFTEIKDLTRKLASELNNQKWDGIVAITRGGLAPAGLITQHLPNRVIHTICLKSYDETKKQRGVNLLYDPKLPNEGKGFLFIDEISDTGETFKFLKKMYPKATFATLYAKPQGKDVADFVGEVVSQDTWLVFPWEED